MISLFTKCDQTLRPSASREVQDRLVARMQAKGRNPGTRRDTFPDSATLHPGYLFGSGLFGLDHG